MQINTIVIEPMAEGWVLRQDIVDNPQVFASGAKAEAAARRLAESLAKVGQVSEIQVFLRDGVLAGRFAWPAEATQKTA
ncbi:MAG TPA: hypothetical protein VG248_07345 [Caulobacteraceae bacterium]|nr:hypothetical protein [Caulobacteraceae bacterium]